VLNSQWVGGGGGERKEEGQRRCGGLEVFNEKKNNKSEMGAYQMGGGGQKGNGSNRPGLGARRRKDIDPKTGESRVQRKRRSLEHRGQKGQGRKMRSDQVSRKKTRKKLFPGGSTKHIKKFSNIEKATGNSRRDLTLKKKKYETWMLNSGAPS